MHQSHVRVMDWQPSRHMNAWRNMIGIIVAVAVTWWWLKYQKSVGHFYVTRWQVSSLESKMFMNFPFMNNIPFWLGRVDNAEINWQLKFQEYFKWFSFYSLKKFSIHWTPTWFVSILKIQFLTMYLLTWHSGYRISIKQLKRGQSLM